jgi:hypothetical protein
MSKVGSAEREFGQRADGGTEGDADSESRTAIECALHLYRSAVQLHKLQHQGKSDTSAFVRAAPLSFDPMESFKEFRHL